MPGEPKIIYSADNTQQAYLLRALLADEGIEARVVNDAIQIAGGDLPVGWTAAAKVVVRDDQAERARLIAEEFDLQTRQSARAGNSLDDEINEPVASWAEWPLCPVCAEKRQVSCSTCGTVGVDWPLADGPIPAEQPLFICPSCDDSVSPRWDRHCKRCGHDFDNRADAAGGSGEGAMFSARTILVIGFLLAGSTALLAYFAWLLRGRIAW
jgi:hypothetical protein